MRRRLCIGDSVYNLLKSPDASGSITSTSSQTSNIPFTTSQFSSRDETSLCLGAHLDPREGLLNVLQLVPRRGGDMESKGIDILLLLLYKENPTWTPNLFYCTHYITRVCSEVIYNYVQ